MLNAGRALALSELRERIERLGTAGRVRAVLTFRVREVDRHLPGGGLAARLAPRGHASWSGERACGCGDVVRSRHSGAQQRAGAVVPFAA